MAPLIFAASQNENPEVINVLLHAGAGIETTNVAGGLTSLIFAARDNKNPEVIMALLKAGANRKARAYVDDRRTAFDFAKDNRNLKDTVAYWALNDAVY